jgi:hypothetical protein
MAETTICVLMPQPLLLTRRKIRLLHEIVGLAAPGVILPTVQVIIGQAFID